MRAWEVIPIRNVNSTEMGSDLHGCMAPGSSQEPPSPAPPAQPGSVLAQILPALDQSHEQDQGQEQELLCWSEASASTNLTEALDTSLKGGFTGCLLCSD